MKRSSRVAARLRAGEKSRRKTSRAARRGRRTAPAAENPWVGLELRGRNVLLRLTELSDGEALYRLVKDRDIALNTYIPYPYRRAYMTGFLKQATEEMKAGKQLYLTIRTFESDAPIGLIALHFRYPQPFRAELGYWLGRPYWNQGIMTQAVKTVIAFAFVTLKLHRLDVSHFEPNDASRRVIEKCWFRREGMEREAVCKQRRWLNIVKYGLLRAEYEQSAGKGGIRANRG